MNSTIRFPGRFIALAAILLVASLLSFAANARAQDATAASGAAAPVTSDSRFECPGCLRPVPPGADRCPECGVSFKKLEYECPKCKTTIPYDAKSCPKCGLVFDAPAPGDKEKRSALPRSMPDTRDFLDNPPAKPDEGLEVNGYSLTLWRTGREMSFDGTTTINRFVEDLSINVLHIGTPGLSFHAGGLLLGDPNLRPERTVDFTLREAYFRYENADETTQINAGRQFVDSGVTREFVDALFLHQMIGDRLGFEVFGGHPVATDKSDPGGDLEFGGRVFWRGLPKVVNAVFRDLTLAVSAREEVWDSRVVREDLGFDFSFSPTWDMDFSGHAYYSLVTRDWYDARATFDWRPTGWLQFSIDYRYIVPADLLPASSIFIAFADDRRHELELDVDIWPSERLKLHAYARGYYVPNEAYTTQVTFQQIDLGTEIPWEIGGGFSYRHGETIKGEFGVDSSLLIRGGINGDGATAAEANVVQIRVYEMASYDVAVKHTIKGSAELHFEANDGKVFKRQNSAATLTLTGGYTYDQKYSFTLGGDYRSTPDFANTYDVFAKLEVSF